MKLRHKLFLGFLGLGLIFMALEEVAKRKNRDRIDYADLEVWEGKKLLSRTLRGKEKEKAKRLIRELAGSGKAVWFGSPKLSECVVWLWDNWEETFYRVCRGKNGKWYVQLPGSWRGRSTERYFEVEERKALEVAEKLRRGGEK